VKLGCIDRVISRDIRLYRVISDYMGLYRAFIGLYGVISGYMWLDRGQGRRVIWS